jgi:hypothetical protein
MNPGALLSSFFVASVFSEENTGVGAVSERGCLQKSYSRKTTLSNREFR